MKDAMNLYRQGRYEEALNKLLAVEVEPEDHGLYSYYLGLCYVRLRRFDEAMLYLEQVVTSDIGFGYTYQCRMILGYMYAETDRLRMAAWEFQRLLNEGFESAKVYSALAHVLFLERNIGESLEKLERALKLEPDNHNALNSMGFVLAEANMRLGQALLYVQKANHMKPQHPAYMDSLGWVYHRMGKRKEAMETLRKAVLLDPENHGIREHLKAVIDAR